MIKRRTIVSYLISLVAGLVISSAAFAHGPGCPAFAPGQTSSNVVEQQFPPNGPMETAWRVRFANATAKGLYITGAWFKKGPSEPWMRVLWDARLADIFVPYHPGSPRYYDLTNFSFPLVNATALDAGACGNIIDGKVIHQVSSRGVSWKDDTAVGIGHELSLWATLDSANYNYIMRYVFQDDGTIKLRIGATSRNLPYSEYTAHMHNGLWRIDMDLNGFRNDSALLYSHSEPGIAATDSLTPFNGGVEGGVEIDHEKFTEVHVRDEVTKNAHGRNISYEFKPVRFGAPRHSEAFAQEDFWVTRYRYSEKTYDVIDSYVNGESVTNNDVVVWHISPLHHDPRDEDGYFIGNSWHGVALVMWSGLDLRPRNLFDATPHFP